MNSSSGCQFSQNMVNQTPKFENQMRRGRRPNQVIGKKSGLIRPDKRRKVKYL